jgi:hypothetical protein
MFPHLDWEPLQLLVLFVVGSGVANNVNGSGI